MIATANQNGGAQIPVFSNNFVMPGQSQQKYNSIAQKTASNGFYSSISAKNHSSAGQTIPES